jgi:hypothetical protein
MTKNIIRTIALWHLQLIFFHTLVPCWDKHCMSGEKFLTFGTN